MARLRGSLLAVVVIVVSVTACGASSGDAPRSPVTFVAGDSENFTDPGSLYVMSVRNPTVLWKAALPESSWLPGPALTWSPDGRQIAVIDETYEQVEIHDALTGATSGTASAPADAPAWTMRDIPGVSQQDNGYMQAGTATSPDGTMDAHAANTESGFDLRIRHAADRKLLAVARAQAPFAWSPDSRFIAASGFFEIVLIDAVNGTSRTLAEAVGTTRSFNFGGLAWSPDGTRLAFTAREDPGVD